MSISLPASLVEHILLGPLDDRRQLQDSPILGDVWVAFGAEPAERVDLLVEPYRGQHAGAVAGAIDDGLNDQDAEANIAFLQNLIVARLKFEEVMRVVVPKTKWWLDKRHSLGSHTPPSPIQHDVDKYTSDYTRKILLRILEAAQKWYQKRSIDHLPQLPALDRLWALTGLILWAAHTAKSAGDTLPILGHALKEIDAINDLLQRLKESMLSDKTSEPLVWQVSRNRRAMLAVSKSISAVKADAAKTLFRVNCSTIGWAVLDSGIDGAHPAFADATGKTRIKRSFDFQNFRKIVSLSNAKPHILEANLNVLRAQPGLKHPLDEEEARTALQRLAQDARTRGPIHWELVEKFVEIVPDSMATRPQTDHGTHVAGIIGASKQGSLDTVQRVAEAAARRAAEAAAQRPAEFSTEEHVPEVAGQAVPRATDLVVVPENPDFADGMCPDITLYDFRVLGQSIHDTEFAIIAALQFIRYLNDRDSFLTIHGVNLSLSIPHDVRNFACGRTPVCEEAERLVSSGVVVVAAAGNHGYKSFETKDGSFESYAAFSITDPGNADSVITVGATHRFWPHTYGVSFFSSRGPTGDGRMKPDLVAPGERIRAPLSGDTDRGGAWGDLDGTSMAAPHVSGAAAMLMARYSELIGQPLRIKRILCDSATDLGRERSFQGHGMLDVLRAFQSI